MSFSVTSLSAIGGKIGSALLSVGKAALGALSVLSVTELITLGVIGGAAIITGSVMMKRFRAGKKYAKKHVHDNIVADTFDGVESKDEDDIDDGMTQNAEEDAQINTEAASRDYESKKSDKKVKKVNKNMNKVKKAREQAGMGTPAESLDNSVVTCIKNDTNNRTIMSWSTGRAMNDPEFFHNMTLAYAAQARH